MNKLTFRGEERDDGCHQIAFLDGVEIFRAVDSASPFWAYVDVLDWIQKHRPDLWDQVDLWETF